MYEYIEEHKSHIIAAHSCLKNDYACVINTKLSCVDPNNSPHIANVLYLQLVESVSCAGRPF